MNYILEDQYSGNFVTETLVEFNIRYCGFGKNIYDAISELLPDIFSKLCLYKNIVSQTEDSYAVYNDGNKSFGIQLDPLCEVVVLWDESVHMEIGYWSNDVYSESIEFIKSHFIST